MSTLALDLGTHTGFAIDDAGVVHSGTKRLEYSRYDGGGVRFVRFRAWLDERHAMHVVRRVGYEAVRAHKGLDAAHVYGGLQATLTAWCEDRGIPYEGVAIGTIKKAATGRGNAPKGAVAKAIGALGFAFDDTDNGHNETDALALLHYMTAGGIGGRTHIRS